MNDECLVGVSSLLYDGTMQCERGEWSGYVYMKSANSYNGPISCNAKSKITCIDFENASLLGLDALYVWGVEVKVIRLKYAFTERIPLITAGRPLSVTTTIPWFYITSSNVIEN
jgi:hypothetical protein